MSKINNWINIKNWTVFLTLLIFVFLLFYPSLRNTCKDPSKVTLVGDLLIGGGRVWKQIVHDDYNPNLLLKPVRPIFEKSDALVANFEGIIATTTIARETNLPRAFSLRTDPKILEFLVRLPTPVLSFANNHSADFGREGINQALSILRNSSIGTAGIGENIEESISPRILQLPEAKISIIAFTDLLPQAFYAAENQSGIAELNSENLKRGIEIAKSNSDFVIVSLHTASETGAYPSFFPDKHQRSVSRQTIDYGADLVIGQHHHIFQKMERYKKGLIFYSLGLFLYDPDVSSRYPQGHPLHNATQFKGGAILNLEFCNKKLENFQVVPIKVSTENGRLTLVVDSFWKRALALTMKWYSFVL